MGQKVNPHGFRVGVIKDWDSRWIGKSKQIADFIEEDDKIRKFIKSKHYEAGISKIEIERAVNKASVSIHTARPGVLIGKGGTGIDVIKAELLKLTGKNIAVNIIEVRRPDLDAQLIAENVASQLEKRVSFRRAMKQSIGRSRKAGLKGIKIMVSGRLGGAEIARSEQYHEGSIPLQTIRADIDYGFAEAHTTYGRIGVKVWAYKGEVLHNPLKEKAKGEQHTERKNEGGRKNVNAKKSQA
ncbi:MAG: 30S ribosomal protein S3 [Christensenellaceae bacterium]|nr:30S ribosomal protein S3 [Christensenellaceae bacterium]